MSKNLNSAARLHRIIAQAQPIADNIQVLEAWARILGVAQDNSFKRTIQVGELIHAQSCARPVERH